MQATPLVVTGSSLSALQPLVKAAHDYVRASQAPNTQRAYRRQWEAFATWCGARGIAALPAEPAAVALYVTALAQAGRKVATIEQALAAITAAHKADGHANPRDAAAVAAVVAGIRRDLGVAQVQKAPVMVDDLRRMVASLPATAKGVRDRAVLLLGFAGAFRRSELVGLDVADLAFGDDGLKVTLRRSKTDQEGAGRKLGVPFGSDPSTCPVRAVKAWLAASGIESGALFVGIAKGGKLTGNRLSPIDVARVVKAAADAVGFDAADYSGHSLRAGLVTSAVKAGKSDHAIMDQTGHRSAMMVHRYRRNASLFADNAAAGIGL